MKENDQQPQSESTKQGNTVPDSPKQAPHTRIVAADREHTIEIMKKIPLFKGFSDEQYVKVQKICSRRNIKKDNYIYYEGEDSSDLFILLKGRLRIMLKGVLLNVLFPICMVGEIGVFTDGNRSASVLADEDSAVIRIPKKDLFPLMQSDTVLATHLLQNVINDLVGKLQEDNRIIVELRKDKGSIII
ncbi:MAG: Crp/Fnr family transcriptional regulator [Candidatus Latescibacterota bacterium]